MSEAGVFLFSIPTIFCSPRNEQSETRKLERCSWNTKVLEFIEPLIRLSLCNKIVNITELYVKNFNIESSQRMFLGKKKKKKMLEMV